MDFIDTILTRNYKAIYVKNTKITIKPFLPEPTPEDVKELNQNRMHYYISKKPQTKHAVICGLPHCRKWYLHQNSSHLVGLNITQSEMASIIRVVAFDLCGLAMINVNQFIAEFTNDNLYYSSDLLNHIANKVEILNPQFDKAGLHGLIISVDDKYYKIIDSKNECMNRETNSKDNNFNVSMDAPKVMIKYKANFDKVFYEKFSLFDFCDYLEYLLGNGVVKILQKPIKVIYEDIILTFYSYRYIHKDKNYFCYEICPPLYDFIVFRDFFNYLNGVMPESNSNGE